MELRQYIRLILKNWWLILAFTLIAVTVTLLFTYAQTPIYQADSTYVTRLNPDAAGNTSDASIFGFDTLLNQQRIFVTYCDVMSSSAVQTRALEIANLSNANINIDDYSTVCTVLPESNVLQLSVTGPAPAVVRNLNQAIGLAGIERINALYPPFPIEQLDEVALLPQPISPNIQFNLLLSVALGLTVSIMVILLLEQLRNPLEQVQARSIYDVEYNLYNNRYFKERVGQEIERSRIHARPVTLSLMRLVPNEDFDVLPEAAQTSLKRAAANLLQDNLRRGDIISHYKNATFQLLLPETSGDTAIEIVTELHNIIRRNYIEAGIYKTNFAVNSGLVEASGGMLDTSSMMDLAQKALEKADNNGKNIIELTRTTPRPFVYEHEGFDLGSTDPNATQPIVFEDEDEVAEPVVSGSRSRRQGRGGAFAETTASASQTRSETVADASDPFTANREDIENQDYQDYSFDDEDFDTGSGSNNNEDHTDKN